MPGKNQALAIFFLCPWAESIDGHFPIRTATHSLTDREVTLKMKWRNVSLSNWVKITDSDLVFVKSVSH